LACILLLILLVSGSCCWYQKKSTHICSVKAKLTIVSVSHGLYSTLVKIFGNINTQWLPKGAVGAEGHLHTYICTYVANKQIHKTKQNKLRIPCKWTFGGESAFWISLSVLFVIRFCGLWVCLCFSAEGRALENRCCRRFYDFPAPRFPFRFFIFSSFQSVALALFSGSLLVALSLPSPTCPLPTSPTKHTHIQTLAFRVAHAGSFEF